MRHCPCAEDQLHARNLQEHSVLSASRLLAGTGEGRAPDSGELSNRSKTINARTISRRKRRSIPRKASALGEDQLQASALQPFEWIRSDGEVNCTSDAKADLSVRRHCLTAILS